MSIFASKVGKVEIYLSGYPYARESRGFSLPRWFSEHFLYPFRLKLKMKRKTTRLKFRVWNGLLLSELGNAGSPGDR